LLFFVAVLAHALSAPQPQGRITVTIGKRHQNLQRLRSEGDSLAWSGWTLAGRLDGC